MRSINRVAISGNLTHDSELRAAGNGTPVLNFRVAVNDSRKNAAGEWEDYANYVDCVLFGARANALHRMMRKGTKVALDGKLRYSAWEAKDGAKRSKLEVAAEEIELMSRPNAQQAQQAEQAQQAGTYDEDLPF